MYLCCSDDRMGCIEFDCVGIQAPGDSTFITDRLLPCQSTNVRAESFRITNHVVVEVSINVSGLYLRHCQGCTSVGVIIA